MSNTNSTTRSNPIRSAIHTLHRTTPTRHAIIFIGSFAALGIVNGQLNNLYAASNHPVSYAEGQTSFSSDKVEGWYGEMEAAGTLDTYVYTQVFDYLFMAALAGFAIALASVISRGVRADSRISKTARIGATAIAAGSILDAIENLWSFAMLARFTSSATIEGWLTMAYSATAVAKFIAIGIGFIVLIAAVVARTASAARATFDQRSSVAAAPQLCSDH